KRSPVQLKIVERIAYDRLPAYLNAADCLVFLSDFEGSPNLIREACACNLPIVSVEVGDVAEVLTGVRGCQIVPRDLQRIAVAVEETALARMRTNGRQRALEFSPEATSEKTLRFYEALC